MEAYAAEHHVPIINENGRKVFLSAIRELRPHRVLEIGTAIGYSALLLAANGAEDVRVTTLELSEARAALARAFIARSPYADRIELLQGDAGELLTKLAGKYDFVFIDAAKGQYVHWLPDALRLLAPGGLLMSDNVLQDGTIVESRYAVERRDRTIHVRMREYLYTLKHMKNHV